MMCTITAILGICLGNTIWLGGLLMLLLGILLVKIKKESIQKIVGVMSMLTGGQPKGPALKLKDLVDPVERQKPLGKRLLLVAIVLLLLGASLTFRCSGPKYQGCCQKPCAQMPCPQKPCPQMEQMKMQPPPLPKAK